jgi:uncharacterized protein
MNDPRTPAGSPERGRPEAAHPRRNGCALVTGASSGIGLELSRVLAQHGRDLVLTARREALLRDLATELSGAHGIGCTVLPADLSDARAAGLLHREVEARGLQVDILVNNAGFGLFGRFAETGLERELEMIRVNVIALTELTKRFLPGMLARRSGRILNVASTAAFQPGPLMAVYYATKAYVLYLSEAVANEVEGSGVTVTALCPGPTRSGFQGEAGLDDSRRFPLLGLPGAAEVARYGYHAMMKGKRVAIPGLFNRLLAESVRIGPRNAVTAVVRRMQERVGSHPGSRTR